MYPEETAFNAELSYLQKYFTQNNFTANLVSKMFQKVIHKIYNPNPKCLSAEKKPMYFLLPYFDNASLEIKRKFILIISRFYPHIQLRSVFTYKFTMSSLFSFVGIAGILLPLPSGFPSVLKMGILEPRRRASRLADLRGPTT